MNLKKLSVSVVIPNYNGKELLQNNLPKVLAAVKSCEVIVVDDASTDTSVAFLKSTYPEITVIEQSRNLRFAQTCNAGVMHANGDVIVLLNNDVVPDEDFLEPLIKPFIDLAVFAVGAAEITDLERPQDVSGKACGTFSHGFLTHRRCEDQESGPTLWASGGSGAFRKSVWTKLGGLDPLYAPAYDEDRDICYRAMKRGYVCTFVSQATVEHVHETTNRRVFGALHIQIVGYRNQLMFTWKNTTDQKFLLLHLLWLPYHLIITSLKSRGLFLIGFILAFLKLPRIFAARTIEKREGIHPDEKILSLFKN